MKFGLKQNTIEAICSCLGSNRKIEKAILYGSRAMGNYTDGSDIDLALSGDQLSLTDLLKLEIDLDDLLLPYKLCVSQYLCV